MEIGFDASSLEDEILGQPRAERVQVLSLALQSLDEIVRLLLHVHQAQVVENECHFVLHLCIKQTKQNENVAFPGIKSLIKIKTS